MYSKTTNGQFLSCLQNQILNASCIYINITYHEDIFGITVIELDKKISPENKRNISLLDLFSYGFCFKSQSDAIIFHRLRHYTYCISNHIFTSYFKNYITISQFFFNMQPKKLIQQYKISKFHTVKTMEQPINSPQTLHSLALESYLVSTNYPCDNSNFSLNINGSKYICSTYINVIMLFIL